MKEIIVMAIIVVALMGVIGWLIWDAVTEDARDLVTCEELGEAISRRVRVVEDDCQVEIAPDMFVSENQVLYYLDFVEPVRE